VSIAKAGRRGSVTLQDIQARGRVRTVVCLLGPAFVASVAYVDPGNFATNFAGGAEHGYELVWVIVMANLMAILVQYLTSKAGLSTGRSLPELCRERFGRRVNLLLWLQAEVVAMATDLAEFVGAAIGLNLVFGLPLLDAGLITAVVAFVILALEQRGYRRFEVAIVALLGLVGAGFLYVFFAVGGQDYGQIADGLVPHLTGGNSLGLTVGIIGATVMPHVIYLHSALQQDRIRAANRQERRTLLNYNRWDCIVGLGIAGLVNLSMLCIAAALFHQPGLTGVSDLGPIHAHLDALIGGGAALAFGIALMASGLSSSSVGTYASIAGHPRARREYQPSIGVLPDRLVLRHPVRPRPVVTDHPRPRRDGGHDQPPADQHSDVPDHGDHHRLESLSALRHDRPPVLTLHTRRLRC
jgi:manganese transport protein